MLQRLKDGAIRVPTFQRPLKWDRQDNRLFFDSIFKSFPVGSLLMWVRDAPAARVELGPFHADVPGRPNAWQVVDGQQRLTALAGALLPAEKRHADFDFVVDTETGDVVGPRSHPPPRWVPLAVLADTERLLAYLHANPSVDVTKVSALSKRLREYPLSAAILEADQQPFVEEVFTRLNTAGKRLTATEVFRASQANRKGDRALSRALQVGLTFDFGRLDESNLLRALKALSGRDPFSDAAIDDEDTGEALVRGTAEAVAFLKSVGVPIVELLPYPLLFGVLVSFFGARGAVLPRNRQLLGYWFWRTTFTFRMGADFSDARRIYRFARIKDESEAVQALLNDVGRELRFPPFDPPPTLRSAEGKALALWLLHLRPRDLETDEPIAVEELLSREKLRAFRQLPTSGKYGLFTAIIYPARTQAQLTRSLTTASSAALASHLLPAPFRTDFINWRVGEIHDGFQEFMGLKRGERDSLRPPLAALAEEEHP